MPENVENFCGEAFLVSADAGFEAMMIEGRLRGAGIVFDKRYKGIGSYAAILMGYSAYGVDFYVSKDMLEKARETLELGAEADKDTVTESEPENKTVLEEIVPEKEEAEYKKEAKINTRRRRTKMIVILALFFAPLTVVVLAFLGLWYGLKKLLSKNKELS